MLKVSTRLPIRTLAALTFMLIPVLFACAPPFPKELRAAVDGSVTFSVLKSDPERYRGRTVMVGGVIVAARNTTEGTFIEVLQNDLDRGGRPRLSSGTQGRFIVATKEFLDPVVYAQNREVTVIGDAAGSKVQRLGDVDYVYPVVRARALHLWEPRGRGPQFHFGIGVWKGL